MGTYNFTTIDDEQFYYSFWDSLTIRQDTTNFTGSIEKYGENRLKIMFKSEATEPNFGYFPQLNGLMYPIVDSLGYLSYPEIGDTRPYFKGSFYSNEININYGNFAHIGSTSHKIQGIKINIK